MIQQECQGAIVEDGEVIDGLKALGLEPPIGVNSETESEAEVTTMEPGNIDMGAESLPNTDEAEAAGKAGKECGSEEANTMFTTTVCLDQYGADVAVEPSTNIAMEEKHRF